MGKSTRKTQAKGGEVRERVLEDHDVLRGLLDGIEALSEHFEAGDADVAEKLRAQGIEFYERFAEHLRLEDRILAPAVAAREKPGEHKLEALVHEHQEQRELLEYLLGRLQKQPLPTVLMAQELRSFAEYVRRDMMHEEKTLLDEAILGRES